MNQRLQKKLAAIQENEIRWQEYETEDADLLLIAYGTVGRICTSVLRAARQEGLKVGLLRPQTLWPFPTARINELAAQMRGVLVAEMSAGQMLVDVEHAVAGRTPVHFYGRMGGVIPMSAEILEAVKKVQEEVS